MEDIFDENLVDEPKDIEQDQVSGDEDKKKDEEEKEKIKTKRKIGPRPAINAERLKGSRGIATMEDFFSNIQMDGQRGTEKKDLDTIMKQLELWTYRLYPRGQFDDCLKKIEKLGTNRVIQNYVKRIRLGLEDGSGLSDVIRDDPQSPPLADPLEDAFDQLVTSTSRPNIPDGGSNKEITSEQRDRMIRNRLIAEERRAARIKRAQAMKDRFRELGANENCETSAKLKESKESENLEIRNSDNSTVLEAEINIIDNVEEAMDASLKNHTTNEESLSDNVLKVNESKSMEDVNCVIPDPIQEEENNWHTEKENENPN